MEGRGQHSDKPSCPISTEGGGSSGVRTVRCPKDRRPVVPPSDEGFSSPVMAAVAAAAVDGLAETEAPVREPSFRPSTLLGPEHPGSRPVLHQTLLLILCRSKRKMWLHGLQ